MNGHIQSSGLIILQNVKNKLCVNNELWHKTKL